MRSNDKLLQIYFVQHDFSGLLLRVFFVCAVDWLVGERNNRKTETVAQTFGAPNCFGSIIRPIASDFDSNYPVDVLNVSKQ